MLNAGFKLHRPFQPAGDQPPAIKKLLAGLTRGDRHQTLLGVTGSGKTFTMANVIAAYQKPTLVIAHNKTLAAQLAQEYKDFFPENAVHYFVSYYDYYQPEAYLAVTDTYIEKEAMINEEIDRLRHATTQALLTRRDVIVVASVSCIYGLGSPADYEAENIKLAIGDRLGRADLLKRLVTVHYERTNADLAPGTFRVRGELVEVMSPAAQVITRIKLIDGLVTELVEINPVSREIMAELETAFLFPAKHFITGGAARQRAVKAIRAELKDQLKELEQGGKFLEAERLKRRTNYDLALIREVGYCSGIENYSRHLSGRLAGEPPDTLLSYFIGSPTSKRKSDFLTIIDESHVTVPQIAGMYSGDKSRKQTLIEHGFRLPSALDNRPLTFEEFSARVGPIIYTSATPAGYERRVSAQIVEQIIRPTGLVDPEIEVRSGDGQIKDFIAEAKAEIAKGHRVLATTLTKKMAEDLSEHLKKRGIKAEYLHSEIKTIERIKILTNFRRGAAAGGFDCLVGVNLLREGLDLPELTLIGILDADKEGFLRSAVSLIQTIGRAARNVAGRVILYADSVTGSMTEAIDETNRRRGKQLVYNQEHRITPRTIIKKISDISQSIESERTRALSGLIKLDRAIYGSNTRKIIRKKERQMREAVKELDFETAALLRDEIKLLTKKK
ncbi:MAG: excinuclease ABC subunit UvrB [Candidatus Vogelbacteria bacterium]|nr:excinuclease ABC subunit UvrB [Candidatus Vogelbacteria bacterium]